MNVFGEQVKGMEPGCMEPDPLQSAHLRQTKALHTYAHITIDFFANNTLFFFFHLIAVNSVH